MILPAHKLRNANPAADRWHARIDARRVPVVIASVPDVGRLITWIHGRAIRAALLCVLGLLVTGAGARITTVSIRRPLPRATT